MRQLTSPAIVIDPSDPIMSVGLNPLEQETPDFVAIAEVAEILKRHWGLDHLGRGRTNSYGTRSLSSRQTT